MKKTMLTQIDWAKMNGLIPAIVQDSDTLQVMMLGYMNKEALQKTLKERRVWFYSRTKKRLWMKGETSGNTLQLQDIYLDCDGDALLLAVKAEGPACHTGNKSCFNNCAREIFSELFGVICDRKKEMPENSYTASLFRDGVVKICEKIDEEAREVVQAAMRETDTRLIEESVDLLYHLFVLLAEKRLTLDELRAEMKRRRS